MATNAKRLTEQDRVTAALALMEALSAAPEKALPIDDACRAAGCSESHLDDVISLISTLADREGGARAIVVRDHAWVRSFGTATQMLPLRLSASEAAALDTCSIRSISMTKCVRVSHGRCCPSVGANQPRTSSLQQRPMARGTSCLQRRYVMACGAA